MAINYWRKGFCVICPHKNTELFGGILPDNVWIEGDLEIIRRVDTIVMLPNWIYSEGAKREHQLARELGKEIIYEKEP